MFIPLWILPGIALVIFWTLIALIMKFAKLDQKILQLHEQKSISLVFPSHLISRQLLISWTRACCLDTMSPKEEERLWRTALSSSGYSIDDHENFNPHRLKEMMNELGFRNVVMEKLLD